MNDHTKKLTDAEKNEHCEAVDDLLSRVRQGNEDAATALYLRYANRLQTLADRQSDPKMAVRVDPEGVVQSVFRTFFRRVNDGQYNVSDGEELWNLLLVISLNKFRSQAAMHRTAKRDVSKTVSLNHTEQMASKSSDEALSVLKMTIGEIIGDLPQTERDVIQLRIEGFELNEIAAKTQRAKRSVERILQNFRARLKNDIEGE